jgi:hypothetical protein
VDIADLSLLLSKFASAAPGCLFDSISNCFTYRRPPR